MRTSRTTSEYTISLGDFRIHDILKPDMFPFNERIPQRVRYSENLQGYVWGKPMMRMMLEVQCLALAIIVTTQVWILTYYGSRIYDRLIGDENVLPLLYLVAIILGTVTYVRPSYWRIVMSLTAYSLCVYFSLMVTNLAMKVLVTPGLAEALQETPENKRVWIPWVIGFAVHLHMSISSIIITFISIRDLYHFSPIVWTGNPEVLAMRKHNIIVSPIAENNNRRSAVDDPAVIVQYI